MTLFDRGDCRLPDGPQLSLSYLQTKENVRVDLEIDPAVRDNSATTSATACFPDPSAAAITVLLFAPPAANILASIRQLRRP